MTVRFLSRQDDHVELEIRDLPWLMKRRYKQGSNISLLCRDCYRSLSTQFKEIVSKGIAPEADRQDPVILLTGVPGIGKSMFSIYYFINMLLDEAFPLKEVVLEYESGMYTKVTLMGKSNRSDPDGGAPWTELQLKLMQVEDAGEHLILSDIQSKNEPGFCGGRWLFIFASPDPARYRCTVKQAPVCYEFIMPTWSEQELLAVGGENRDAMYDRFVLFGGVPRYVLWPGEGRDPAWMLTEAMPINEPRFMESFFSHGYWNTDQEQRCMLVHINPPWSSEKADWDYQESFEYSFASDEIFRRLLVRVDQSLLDKARTKFNAGTWLKAYGPGFAGHLFKKLVLWWTPLATKTVTLMTLADPSNQLTVTLPAMKVLPRWWKAAKGSSEGELDTNCLYQPRIANLESGDAFCVISEMDGSATLIVLQVTVGETHPINVNGLKNIVQAYPLTVQKALVKKCFVFVTPVHGALQRQQQPLHTQEGAVATHVPSEAQGFQQYVVEYDLQSPISA